jgi:NlpC/P60 family putative phage cell wall peptidase
MPHAEIRQQIVDEARQWLGTPWHHQQSCKGVGCDCIGLVRGVAHCIGFTDPFRTGEASRFMGYARSPEPNALKDACAQFLRPITVGQMLPGDVMTFRFDKFPMHFAIYAGGDPAYMIHGYARARKVVENRVDETWWSRFVGAHRFRELA